MNLLRRVQEAQEGANKVPELERELKSARERIGKLELSSVQAAEMHQQSMNQPGERLARLESQGPAIPCIGEFRDRDSQGGAGKAHSGAPNLGPGPPRGHVSPNSSSDLGKSHIGHPGRAKDPKGTMGGAEPAVQSGPEPGIMGS